MSATSDLNHDLNLIRQWASKWKMFFNPDPTKQAVEITFSRKRKPIDHPPILFNDTPALKFDQHKHLVLVLDRKLSFNSHIKSAISKSRRGIGMIKHLSKYLPRQTLNELCKLYVRSHLDYSDVIYHIPATKCDNSESLKLNHMIENL